MADNAQMTKFPQGVDVADIAGVHTVKQTNGSMVRSSVTNTVTATIGPQRLLLGTATQFNGYAQFRLVAGSAIATVTAVVSANYQNDTGTVNSVQVLTSAYQGATIFNFIGFELRQNNATGRIALVAIVNFTQGTTCQMDCVVSGIGVATPNQMLTLSDYPVVQTGVVSASLEDVVVAKPISKATGEYNLNTEVSPSVITCEGTFRATTGSRPTGSTGLGTCFVQAANGTNQTVNQLWMEAGQSSIYTRSSTNKGTTWTAWATVYTSTNSQELLDAASSNALMWAIVMG